MQTSSTWFNLQLSFENVTVAAFVRPNYYLTLPTPKHQHLVCFTGRQLNQQHAGSFSFGLFFLRALFLRALLLAGSFLAGPSLTM
jgi:hypothetical protein